MKSRHKLQHYSRGASPTNPATSAKKKTTIHTPNVIVSPILALGFGGPGVLLGLATNGWQVWTSVISFIIMITARGGWLNFLPVATSTGDAAFNHAQVTTGISWLLALAVQFGVAFFSLRVDRAFLQQLSQAEGDTKARIKDAAKKTFVEVTHNRDFFFYYGMFCFGLDGLGDYQFCITLTGNIVFMAIYGVILMATSTFILAIAAEWLWAGIKAFLNAWAVAQENARRAQAATGGN